MKSVGRKNETSLLFTPLDSVGFDLTVEMIQPLAWRTQLLQGGINQRRTIKSEIIHLQKGKASAN